MPHHSRNSFVPNWFDLERIPGTIEYHLPLRLRADPVEPVVAGDEIAPRIANDGHAEVFDFPRDVGAESLRIGEAGPGLVDARVDGAAQVFEERTEHAPIEVAAARRSAKKRPRRATAGLRVAHRRQPCTRDGDACGAAEARQKSSAIA